MPTEEAGSNRGRATNIICSFGALRPESEGYVFQACSIDHSDISPFRFNKLRAVRNGITQNLPSRTSDLGCPVLPAFADTRLATRNGNCDRPSNLARSLTAISLGYAQDGTTSALAAASSPKMTSARRFFDPAGCNSRGLPSGVCAACLRNAVVPNR